MISAYDVDPFKGSEGGSGWNFIFQASKHNSVIAVTRKNNQGNIEKYIAENNIDTSSLKFYYYDLPRWVVAIKRGARFSNLYFYLWQLFLPFFIRDKSREVDLVHALNFHTDSVPSFLWLLGKPTVWGPINHNEPIPRDFISPYEVIKDRAKFVFKWLGWNFGPFNRLTRKQVDLIIAGQEVVAKRLRLKPGKFKIMSTIGASSSSSPFLSPSNVDDFQVAVVGRLVPIKGIKLALLAFDRFFCGLDAEQRARVRLNILGDGPLRDSLQELASSFESSSAISFKGWVPHSGISDFYASQSVLLNCSTEGAGAVVAEAMSAGLPVIYLDGYGSSQVVNSMCGVGVALGTLQESSFNVAEALNLLFQDSELRKLKSLEARRVFESDLLWSAKGHKLQEVYMELMQSE